MSPHDLTSLLTRRPFHSFRVVTSDGTTYEVKHPSLAWVTTTSLFVGLAESKQTHLASRYDIVDLTHIARVETVGPTIKDPAKLSASAFKALMRDIDKCQLDIDELAKKYNVPTDVVNRAMDIDTLESSEHEDCQYEDRDSLFDDEDDT